MHLSPLSSLYAQLGYANSFGLVHSESLDISLERELVWREAEDKFDIDAVYFQSDTPIVYFKEFASASDAELGELHKHLWNHNSAPILVAVTSDQIRVYNCFVPPQRDEGSKRHLALLKSIDLATSVINIENELRSYTRAQVDAGSLNSLLDPRQRVDRRLLDNLTRLRHDLFDAQLSLDTANTLIIRSLFVRYLEDRNVLTPEFLSKDFGYESYCSLLEDKHKTYDLFRFLAGHFNGALLPIEPSEEVEVTSSHLKHLGAFLGGNQLSTEQLCFWAYDFEYIPIELLSSIYEEFLYPIQRETGAYYTSPEVVRFVLNRALPPNKWTMRPRILDPSCGSGLFLIESYRRIVYLEEKRRAKKLPFDDLQSLLIDSIFGIDSNANAVRIAAFGCHLALLDFLEPKTIWETAKFENLIGLNFKVLDAFDGTLTEYLNTFDLVVGNPPWSTSLSPLAREYIRERRDGGRPTNRASIRLESV